MLTWRLPSRKDQLQSPSRPWSSMKSKISTWSAKCKSVVAAQPPNLTCSLFSQESTISWTLKVLQRRKLFSLCHQVDRLKAYLQSKAPTHLLKLCKQQLSFLTLATTTSSWTSTLSINWSYAAATFWSKLQSSTHSNVLSFKSGAKSHTSSCWSRNCSKVLMLRWRMWMVAK